MGLPLQTTVSRSRFEICSNSICEHEDSRNISKVTGAKCVGSFRAISSACLEHTGGQPDLRIDVSAFTYISALPAWLTYVYEPAAADAFRLGFRL